MGKPSRPPQWAEQHMIMVLHGGRLCNEEACSAMTATIWTLLPRKYTAAARYSQNSTASYGPNGGCQSATIGAMEGPHLASENTSSHLKCVDVLEKPQLESPRSVSKSPPHKFQTKWGFFCVWHVSSGTNSVHPCWRVSDGIGGLRVRSRGGQTESLPQEALVGWDGCVEAAAANLRLIYSMLCVSLDGDEADGRCAE